VLEDFVLDRAMLDEDRREWLAGQPRAAEPSGDSVYSFL